LGDLVLRPFGVAREIFDGGADQARLGAATQRLDHSFGRIAKAILQIGAERHVHACGQRARMRDDSLAPSAVVPHPNGTAKASAGGSESFEAEPGKQACGPDVPRVGKDEGVHALV
jgi:hypothetical protein